MSGPVFDPTTAINMAAEAAGTVLAVLVGGLLAFKLGIRQLRQERALDRRLSWYERLLSAIEDYRTPISMMIALDREIASGVESARLDRAFLLKHTTDQGRQLQNLLGHAKLYATPEIVAFASDLFRTQLDVYISTWRPSADPEEESKRLQALAEHLARLDGARDRVVESIRSELGLGSVRALPAHRGRE